MRRFRDPFKFTEYLIRKASKIVAKREADKIKQHIDSTSEAAAKARVNLQEYINQRN